MKKYKVYGRIKAEIEFEEIVEAKGEKSALKLVERSIYTKCGITRYDVLDDEIYVDKVEDKRA